MKKFSFYLCVLIIGLSSCKKEQGLNQSKNDKNITGFKRTITEQDYAPRGGVLKTGYYKGRLIKYRLINGRAFYQGDMVIPLNQISQTLKRTASTGKWEVGWNGTVHYFLPSGFPNPSRVTQAIAEWETKTNLHFVAVPSLVFGQDVIVFSSSTDPECSSEVGMQGGWQIITLSAGCLKGEVIHEIGHAVGLHHEQCRSDRNSYVTVNFNNIQDDYEDQFDIESGLESPVAYGVNGLDFESIMMYSSWDFSIDEGSYNYPTMKKVSTGQPFDVQRDHLSSMDIGWLSILHPKTIEGVGASADGAGIAYYKIPGTNTKMLFVMAYDSPGSNDEFRYKYCMIWMQMVIPPLYHL